MNPSLNSYLAQSLVDAAPKLDIGHGGKLRLSGESTLILALAGAVTLAVFAWAFFFRRRRPSDPHRQVIEAGAMSDDGDPAAGENHSHHHRRHRHRRRHRGASHTRRNPTLQETGGLPPARPEDQLPAA